MTVYKMFWDDPYLAEIHSRVTGVEGNRVTLDRTIAYAFSGGQASDSGTIGGYRILEAEKEEKEIWYTLEPGHGLKIGDEVCVRIDWQKRYKIMRLHFAAEIVLELMYQNFNKPEKIGANITEEKARVDFVWDGNISEVFPLIQAKAGELIQKDLPVISDFSDRESEKRYWQIEGFGMVPCGGTHLRRTGEIGGITLKRKNLGGGKERIEISLV